MTWEGSNRREELPDDWEERVQAIRTRSGNRCEIVGIRGRCRRPMEDCDHKVPGNDHSLDNLQAICKPHHAFKTAQEANAAKRTKAALRYRPAERHPGLLAPSPRSHDR